VERVAGGHGEGAEGEEDVKKYTIEVLLNEEGKKMLYRRNDGFLPYELLGILEETQLDIIRQLGKEITPDIIKREVVEPPKEAKP
jgi:hypothetical protein